MTGEREVSLVRIVRDASRGGVGVDLCIAD